MLFKLFHLKLGNEMERERMYSNLQKEYSDENKFFIPMNEEELFSALKSLQG